MVYDVGVEVNYSGKYVGVAACGEPDGRIALKKPSGNYIGTELWSTPSCNTQQFQCIHFQENGGWRAELWAGAGQNTLVAYKDFIINPSSWPADCGGGNGCNTGSNCGFTINANNTSLGQAACNGPLTKGQ